MTILELVEKQVRGLKNTERNTVSDFAIRDILTPHGFGDQESDVDVFMVGAAWGMEKAAELLSENKVNNDI